MCKRCLWGLLFLLTVFFAYTPIASGQNDVGVIFVVHGGFDTYRDQYVWDAGVQQFSYDPNHSVYKFVIWNPAYWFMVLQEESSVKFARKYQFEYQRIGGTDPFGGLTLQQLADMETELDANPYDINFEVDWAGWMCGDCIEHYPYPRFMYYGPDGPGVGSNLTYCGESEPGGPWSGCDPDRYNVDGPVERLLTLEVSKIIMVDLTVGGPRFSKTYDVVQMTKHAIDDWNAAHSTSIPYPIWVNDYSSLMERSYPLQPPGWTSSLMVPPTLDSHVLFNSGPNPIAADPELADLQVESIEAAMSGSVADEDTGVIILDHALVNLNELFDPKIDDTLIINKNIKTTLLAKHPTMDPDNIIGAYMGIKELNPANGLVERNREMRGEDLGNAWLYESNKQLPGDEWGYLYWDALEYLKNRGVHHIVIGFAQIITDSVLNLVEIPNQIGKEIGLKSWLKYGIWDYTTYPGVGHPFTDYWGNWVNIDCGEWKLNYEGGTVTFHNGATLTGQTSGAQGVIKWFTGTSAGTLTLKQVTGTFLDNETIKDSANPKGTAVANGTATQVVSSTCCFVMGGCNDPLRPYPPPRQTPISTKMSDMDPYLAYDLSDYGHLGYDPGMGAPDPNNPVQDQYTGTWEMYYPPSGDDRVGQLLAKHVIAAAVDPLVYITNGELCSTNVGEGVTWVAHVVSGTPAYTYEWSTKEAGDPDWTTVGGNSSSWNWNPVSGDEGIYAVRCRVTDSLTRTGEVIWEGFIIGDSDHDCIPNDQDNCPVNYNPGQEDSEIDGVADACDNCPTIPNGSLLGTCVNCNTGSIGPSCTDDGQCTSGYCSMDQNDIDNDGLGDLCDDSFPPGGNGCIDACECEGDFDRDGDGDGSDAIKFKIDFGRKPPTNPCTAENPCNGDFDCDGNVDGSDAILFKRDFGRRDCPSCAGEEWCSY